METPGQNYLTSSKKLFHYYKSVADSAIEQVTEAQLNWRFNNESNSMAVIIKHIASNSISRWTDFMNSDGEKSYRNRDEEFETSLLSKKELLLLWEKGWQCLFDAIDPLTENDLSHIVYIRNEGHTVMEAINRQLAHNPYHIGQIVYLAKMSAGENWTALTIPKGKSKELNAGKFSAEKERKFFSDKKG